MKQTVRERLLSKVRISETGCWEWLGAASPKGYGRINVDGKNRLAHRISYALFVGPLADDLQIDHLCRNRKCCNPEHLEQVTGRENTLRGESFSAQHARKTHCKRGHEFTADNLTPSSFRLGRRECLKCVRLRNAARDRRVIREAS